jgi:23S rRNA (pseudouridine1915-N3)-methyltransferase
VKIKIVTVGKLKEKYLVAGIAEYAKRLGAYAKLEFVEVADEKCPEVLSEREMALVKEREAARILAKIGDGEFVFALAIDGVMHSSESFAAKIDTEATRGKSTFTFVIGGSLGLDDSVLARANEKISFGKLTYPHQLMKLILVEQIYRTFRINRGEPYHK